MNFRTRLQRVVLIIAMMLPATTTLVAESPKLVAPGRWEITLRNELPAATAPVSYFVCIEPGEAERPEPPKSKPSDPCHVIKSDLVGNELSYTTKCGRKKSSSVRYTYGVNSYEGVFEMVDNGVMFRQIISAKRMGSCDDPMPEQEN